MKQDLTEIKLLPIKEVATRLGIRVRGNKAMCFAGHDKRTPSLSFVPSKNIWKCFGCDGKGDSISLVMKVLSCDFREALAWFANEFGVRVGFNRNSGFARQVAVPAHRRIVEPFATSEKTQEFVLDAELYTSFVNATGIVSATVGLNYLENRGIPIAFANRVGIRELRSPPMAFQELMRKWGAERVLRSGIAWDVNGNPSGLIWKSYALLFPFYTGGMVRFLQGRVFTGDPKYLSLRGISKPLYNLDRISLLAPGSLVHICEGVPDVLALEANGFAAVGVLGASSFRKEWVDHFLRFDVVLLPHGDKAGEVFRRSITEYFGARGKALRSLQLPPGTDVAEVVGNLREPH